MFVIGPDRDLLWKVKDPSGSIYYIHIGDREWVVAMRGSTLHALDADQVSKRMKAPSRRRTYDAVCGAKVRLWPYPAGGGILATALWPPRLATLRNGATRCASCHEATGRRRPSGYFPEVGTDG